jgi:hypothetical protein
MSKSFLISLFVIAILAWSPWLNKSAAEVLIVDDHSTRWSRVADGCSIEEIRDTRRVPFGFVSSVEYRCGLTIAGAGGFSRNVFVSLLMTVHGGYRK